MKQGSIRKITAGVSALALALALGGCAEQARMQSSTDENAAANRQYMAQLNQKMDTLQQVMGKFQQSVSEEDAVGMRAQASQVDKVLADVRALQATASLEEVKGLYVDALDQVDAAMDSYLSLYNDLAAGSLDSDEYNRRLAEVQIAYNRGIEALRSADQRIEDLATDNPDSSSSSGEAQAVSGSSSSPAGSSDTRSSDDALAGADSNADDAQPGTDDEEDGGEEG